MTSTCSLHTLPLEIRELIYTHIVSYFDPYGYMFRLAPRPYEHKIAPKPVALQDMPAFDRAVIPDRKIYREFLAHRIRNSVLVLKPEWPARPPTTGVLWELKADVPLLYPSVEDMSPLARDSLRRVRVRVPGYPESVDRWNLSAWDLDLALHRFTDPFRRVFPVASLASTIFMPLRHARNVQSITLDFTYLHHHNESLDEEEIAIMDEEEIKIIDGWKAFAHRLASTDFGSYLNMFTRLCNFEIHGHYNSFRCLRCLDNPDIWEAFDECFIPVCSRSSLDQYEFWRVWRVWNGENLSWRWKTRGFLEWK